MGRLRDEKIIPGFEEGNFDDAEEGKFDDAEEGKFDDAEEPSFQSVEDAHFDTAVEENELSLEKWLQTLDRNNNITRSIERRGRKYTFY